MPEEPRGRLRFLSLLVALAPCLAAATARAAECPADAFAPCYVSIEPPGAMGRFHYFASQPPLNPVRRRRVGMHGHPRDDSGDCPDRNHWKYGTEGLPATLGRTGVDARARYSRADITYLEGELDSGSGAGTFYRILDKSCAARAQGPYRLQRGLAYAAFDRVLLVPGKGAGSWSCLAVRMMWPACFPLRRRTQYCSVQESDGLALRRGRCTADVVPGFKISTIISSKRQHDECWLKKPFRLGSAVPVHFAVGEQDCSPTQQRRDAPC